MQTHDQSPIPPSPIQTTPFPDQPTMAGPLSSPIRPQEPTIIDTHNPQATLSNGEAQIEPPNGETSETHNKKTTNKSNNKKGSADVVLVRRERPSRACTARAKAYVEPPLVERRSRPPKKEKAPPAPAEETPEPEEVEEEDGDGGQKGQCGKIITPLLNAPPPGQIPRWELRAMWELASVLNFFNVFRPLLNIKVEFSAEELETAIITPNDTLSDIHIPLLKAIPPVTRMACGQQTWVTVLCRKLRDWWHWVAEGELPVVAAHGAEVDVYKSLDPGVRVRILKALCDIRVEQDDIRSYIDDCMKHGVQLSAFRKERIGGDSHGISYWYEDDPLVGHRLYREIRKVEVKKAKIKGSNVLPSTMYDWETVATNLDEFIDVAEKLFSSKSRTEASLGKKLKNDFLPEIEKIHKKKEKLLKKQQREALLLDSYVNMDGLLAGRSLRDRKPVTYTFDDYDRSINEAIKITKRKQPSPEPGMKREEYGSSDPGNSSLNEASQAPRHVSFSPPSPPEEYDEMDEDHKSDQPLDRSNRRRQRPQRYSDKEYVGTVSENDGDFDSDDEIVGEAVYDEEYLRKKQRRRASSGSEGDEEYHWSDEENGDEEEEEEDDNDSFSMSDDSDGPRKIKKLPGRTRRETKLRLGNNNLQPGLRRSRRSNKNRINYSQYEMSDSDHDMGKRDEPNTPLSPSLGSDDQDSPMESPENEATGLGQNEATGPDQSPVEENHPANPGPPPGEPNGSSQEAGAVQERHFLDLNEAAPGSGFEDGPTGSGGLTKDEEKNGEP